MRKPRLTTPAPRLGRLVRAPGRKCSRALERSRAIRLPLNGRRSPASGPPSRTRRAVSAAPRRQLLPPGTRTRSRSDRLVAGRRSQRAERRSSGPSVLGARAKRWGRAAGGSSLGAGRRSAGRAHGGPVRAIRRRRTSFPAKILTRGGAVWRAKVPEAVKPFLAVQETVLRCPTCKAWQIPSLECRRCKCDLSLVAAVHDQQRRLHAKVLRKLASGRHAEALWAARSRWSLSPDPEAARLLSVCFLLVDRFQTARDVYDKAT